MIRWISDRVKDESPMGFFGVGLHGASPRDHRRSLLLSQHGFGHLPLAVLLVLATLSASCGRGGDTGATTVSGRVTLPLSGALVYIYQEGDDLYSPPRMVSDATGDDGAFALALRPGKYLAVVRKRATGESAGRVWQEARDAARAMVRSIRLITTPCGPRSGRPR